MNEQKEQEDKPLKLDGYLEQNLNVAKKVIKDDWDMLFIVDGYEGSGKSVLAMQMAKFCDPTFNIDRVVFKPAQFIEAIDKSEKFQSIVYDEAYTGLYSKEAMTELSRTLVKKLAEIRQKNLFIFIVMPTFFDLNKYVAIWRSRALIHVYTSDNFERGRFCFFNVDRKKILFVLGKKTYNYNATKSNFYGRFSNKYVVDQELYRKLKKENSESIEEDDGPSDSKFRAYRNAAMYILNKECKLSQTEIANKISKLTGFECTNISVKKYISAIA